ncbi:YwmB family TATA-box binding protein [Oceanobacillus halophilus]|uniref:TATA-box binding n=1 Tax=Oceanobacillus halophilus TaxID=930130 RepID=A0A495A527_9BACI|nr:YwmB family TATA-box binding protein [Oceanobacillus halophilus]RKQ34369.1 hypothetical protein D8M06_08330 [Oceanobacillus halophilus]
MLRIIFTTIFILFTANATVQGLEMDELEDMVSFVDSQNLTVSKWQVVMKEKMEEEAIREIIEELKNSYKVTRTEDENIIKYHIRDTHKEASFNVIYSVVLPKDKVSYPELTVVIEGEAWDESVQSDYRLIKDSISAKYFTKSQREFAWLRTTGSDIISGGAFEHNLTNHFNLQHQTTQLDKVSNSVCSKYIYGYTQKWNEKITIENTPINIQVAITKNDKSIPEMTLGTPILINEY